MRQISHPSKEQVRAYMQLREGARRPPPAPAEIRRQLGWSLAVQDGPASPCGSGPFFLPGTIGQLAALLVLEWLFRASLLSQPCHTRAVSTPGIGSVTITPEQHQFYPIITNYFQLLMNN
jgi:hypothetical protein